MYYIKNASIQDYAVRSQRLCIPFKIVHHATPASKTLSNDLPDALILSCEGLVQTTDTGATFTTEADSTGVFGCLLHNLGTVKTLLKFDMVNLSSGTVALTAVGASSTGVTASGNIAISADWNGSLATTDLTAVLCVDYIISKA